MTIQQTTLKNGLKIITATLADARSLTANIVIGTGSRYEDFNLNGGVSHFLEHLLFKGSTKYPTTEAISLAVDAVGGYNNASISTASAVNGSSVTADPSSARAALQATLAAVKRPSPATSRPSTGRSRHPNH